MSFEKERAKAERRERTLSEESVRDLFAMVALQSLMASGYDRTSDPELAYTIADTMMKARKP